jgi:hypothetical protein
MQETNVVAPAAWLLGSIKNNGNGCPPVTARSTELLEVVLDRRRMLPMDNHSYV